MTSIKIKVYIWLARRAGGLLGMCARTQTRLLTAAQFHGWRPESVEAEERLARRQFQLFLYRKSKAQLKLRKMEARAKILR